MKITDTPRCMGKPCQHAAMAQEASGKATRLVIWCVEAGEAIYKLGACPLGRWDGWATNGKDMA